MFGNLSISASVIFASLLIVMVGANAAPIREGTDINAIEVTAPHEYQHEYQHEYVYNSFTRYEKAQQEINPADVHDGMERMAVNSFLNMFSSSQQADDALVPEVTE